MRKTAKRYAYFRSEGNRPRSVAGHRPAAPIPSAAMPTPWPARSPPRRHGSSEADVDSLAWLVDRYLHSAEFAALADPTQADYAPPAPS
jgi:hypothetical protein